MGVPHIALLPVVGFGGVLAEGDRHQPFELFVAEAGEHDDGEGEWEGPGFCGGDLDEAVELGVERMACRGLDPVVVGDVRVEPAGGYGVDG